jgi:hypothetical protein
VAGELSAPVHHVLGVDPRLAPGFVHAVNPEHGEPVTIQPGELMPGWMLEVLMSGGSLTVDGPGEFTLVEPKRGKR